MPNQQTLEKILRDPNSTSKERTIAHRLIALNLNEEEVRFSPESQELLRSLGENHLLDVSHTEWSEHRARLGPNGLDEYWNWHAPDDQFLQLISGREHVSAARVDYWTGIRDRTTDKHVRAHALSQIKLENDNVR